VIDRRVFLAGLAAVVAAPPGAPAQQAGKVHRVGFLSSNSASDPRWLARLGAFQQGIRELGYVEGENIVIESRWAEGKWDRLPRLAAELVGVKADVIVTYGPPAIAAAKQATSTIPIVMTGVIDPIATGSVASLARPGGNMTGLSLMAPEMVGKQLEIIKEVVPGVSRVALLANPANPGSAPQLLHAKSAEKTLGLRLQIVEARSSGDIDAAFATIARRQVGAIIVLVDVILLDHRTRIADLALMHRLPAVYGMSDHAEAGGLLAYGPSVLERYRRAAIFVDKILRGAKAGDLPIEQPTKFELVVNMKTARALGLTIPPSLLLRADQVIE
jgi:putative tryptophan/tyrosine transport system substrate-binding protein